MFAKIENGQIVYPPHNDGNQINVHINLKWLSEHGYTNMTAEEIAAVENAGKPERTVFTKLAIRRAMRALGIEEKLDAILDFSATFRSDWTDAQEIDLADPMFLAALQTGGISENEIAQIKAQIGGAV